MEKRIKLKEARGIYAAEIDPAQLAREPIILERNGEPVGAVISLEEFRAFVEWKKNLEQSVDFPPEWRAEKAAFEQMLPDLLRTYRGKWVAVHQGIVVDSDEKPGELMWRIEQKYGDTAVYIGEAVDPPHIYRITSAWIKHP